MLNLDKTLNLTNYYVFSKDFYFRGFLYSFASITFINLLRSQVSEINLLQLIPGFYLIVLFLSFLFLIIFSGFFVRIPTQFDYIKSLGTKTLPKLNNLLQLKLTSFLLLFSVFFSLTNILPISLDSLDSYGEKTLENIWSFDEVINLEIILISIIIIMSQIPTFILVTFSNEKFVNFIPEFWKIFSFLIFLIAGFLTPTVDGYTQLNFSFSAIFLYLYIINLIEKRISTKFNSFKILGF